MPNRPVPLDREPVNVESEPTEPERLMRCRLSPGASESNARCSSAGTTPSEAGPPGAQGPRGDAGPAGADGKNSLSSMAAEPKGCHCKWGGIAVQVGIDDDGDAALDTEEVDATMYLCNLDDGTEPGCTCRGGAETVSFSPGRDMVVCDMPDDSVCEENFETLCPTNWQLCTPAQHQARNEGWTFAVGHDVSETVLGEIACRSFGAGHYTISTGHDFTTLGDDGNVNCQFGSSRDSCTAGYGCGEQAALALCCAPTASCGNGIVDSVEEQCDDGNADETDACLTNCAWRKPSDQNLDTCD